MPEDKKKKYFEVNNRIEKKWKNIFSHYGLDWKNSFIKWDNPEDLFIDFSITVLFSISKKLKRNYQELALEIKNIFFKNNDDFYTLKIEKGYINCNFVDSFYIDYLNYFINDLFFFEKKNISINVEFVSVNPTGYLHIGHLRNAVFGDTLSNIYKFIGYDVSKEYYVNDRGNQIKNLMKSIFFYYSKKQNIDLEYDEKDLDYKGASTKDAAEYLFNLNNIQLNRDNFNNDKFSKIIIDFFVEKIKKDLLYYGIIFDNWFFESEIYSNKDKIIKLIDNFKSKKLIYENEKAIFLKTTLTGDDKDRVLVKKDGKYTYFFSDILYHLNKLQRSNFLINVWGSDHHGYVSRLLGAIQFLGYNSDRISVILIQLVNLFDLEGNKKFSKRLDNTINISEIFNDIGSDQLRFCLLEKEVGHTLSINLEILIKQQENSRLYYLQYAHARCNQLIEKWKSISKNDLYLKDIFLLDEKKERKILNLLVKFPQIIVDSAEEKKPCIITNYLQLISKEFQSYYQNYQILNNDDYNLSFQRIILIKAIKKTLKIGLSLCGIKASSFMEKEDFNKNI